MESRERSERDELLSERSERSPVNEIVSKTNDFPFDTIKLTLSLDFFETKIYG